MQHSLQNLPLHRGATSRPTPVMVLPAVNSGIVQRRMRTGRTVQRGSAPLVLLAAREAMARLLRLLPSPTCLVVLRPVLFAARGRVVTA